MNISEHKCCRSDEQQDGLSLDGMKERLFACILIYSS